MEAPALCFLSAKPIQIEKPHRSYGIWQVPDSDRYKTDSNLRQILLILCTYTLPTHEHSAPLELFLQSLAKELPSSYSKINCFQCCSWGQIGFILIGTSIFSFGALQTEIKPIQNATCKLALPVFFGCGSFRPIQNR